MTSSRCLAPVARAAGVASALVSMWWVSAAWAQPAPTPAAPAATKPKTATLGWARLDGAEKCIGTQELARSVESLLGRATFVSAAEAELAVEGRVEKKKEGGFRAVLSIATAKGEAQGSRELEVAGACSELNEPVALAIALLIDPDAELGTKPAAKPPDPPAPPVLPSPPAPAPVKTVVVTVPVPAPERPVWSGDVYAGFAMGFGSMPNPSPGVVAGASLTPPHFVPFESVLTFFAPHDEEAPREAFVRFYALQGGGFLCPLAHQGSLGGVRACGGFTGGFIVADGEGFDREDPDESGIYGTFGVSVRGRGTLRVYELFHLGLAAELTVPFFRPDFVYGAADGATLRIFQPAVVSASLGAFALLSFP